MKYFLMIFLVIFSLGCSETKEEPIDNLSDNNRELDSSQVREIEFQRIQDSILKNYSNAIKLINQIDFELSRIANASPSAETYSLEMEVLQKIDYLSFQLKSRNDDINKLEIKLKSLSKDNAEYIERIKTLETIIAEKDKIIENQNRRIFNLEGELAQTKSERDNVIAEKENIEKFAVKTEKEKNTAFYIVGKEKELENKKVIKMEGEGFLGIGGRYVPSTDADLSLFQKIDILSDTMIAIPNNVKKFEIISTHSRRMLELYKSESGMDYLKVNSPDIFWRTDKTLIIVVE
ncbi:MAG: hypothetical protein KIT33_04870 [Candidatus Kapabacteria bacterium]|nr:hypothetical protein [Ignavibacteriota bacterium]MCW5884290.1 hypothetical protein [Candidatus Kapabacteria bacterium]